MARFYTKFESIKQDYATPQDLYMAFHKIYDFEIDLAADSSNHKCDKYFTEEQDALKQDWIGRCWLNPPFGSGSIGKWVKKAYEESIKHGSTIAVLIPARTNTRWWHDYVMYSGKLYYILGRPKFGDSKHGLPQPLVVVVFTGYEIDYPLQFTFDLKTLKVRMRY